MLDHPIFINGMEIQIPEVRKKMVLATSTWFSYPDRSEKHI
jgi:hypothetical protein